MGNELSQAVRDKLEDTVSIWAEENLVGKPALLATAVYFSLEKLLIEKQKEIENIF